MTWIGITSFTVPTANIYKLRGQPNGIASLDENGRVPTDQIYFDALNFKGNWNASTNSPHLQDGTGTSGDTYLVTVAGTQNLGSGNITFDINDFVVYNGETWGKSGSSMVFSVNGYVGTIVLTTDDIDEGITNLYFTNARARLALSANTPLVYDDSTGTFSIQLATSGQNGYLSSIDWSTFNNKQEASGKTGSEIADSVDLTQAATDLNVAGTLVQRANPNGITEFYNVALKGQTGGRAAYLDPSFGRISASSTTQIELGFLSGVTSSIQTQFSNVQTQLSNKQDLDANLTSLSSVNLSINTSGLTTSRTLTIPDANTITIQPKTLTTNEFLTYIDSTGMQYAAQPSASNLSDGTNGSGKVILSSGTLVITSGKTLTCNKNITFDGNDGSTLTLNSSSSINQNLTTLSDVQFNTVKIGAAGLTETILNVPALVGPWTSKNLYFNVNGGDRTISLNGNFSTSGNFNLINTLIGNTNVTFPTAGTLATLAGSETLSNKTLVTPVLGVANATSINGLTISSSTGTLTISSSKTLTVSNTLTFSGTDGSTIQFGNGGTIIYQSNPSNTPLNLNGGTLTSGTTSVDTFLRLGDNIGSGNYLQINSGETLSANRILSLIVNNAARTLTISGNSTINQNVSTAGTPTFAGITSPNLIGGTGTTSTLTLKSTSGVGATGADIIFQTGNNGATEVARMLNNGNVGIGKSSPQYKLHVQHTSNTDGLTIQNGTGGASSTTNLYFQTYGDAGGVTRPNAAISAIDSGNFSANVIFYTKAFGSDANSLTERMRIIADSASADANSLQLTGSLIINTAGKGFQIKSAAVSGGTANALFVTGVVLTAGASGTINNSAITTSHIGFATATISGGTRGSYLVTCNNGSFSVTSSSATDTSTVAVGFIKPL
jgi:hypothetical protein